MKTFGFTIDAMYRLHLDELAEVAHFIKGKDAFIPADKDVIIRGIILPFMRDAVKLENGTGHALVLRRALLGTAKYLGLKSQDWDVVSEEALCARIWMQWRCMAELRFGALDAEDQQAVIAQANQILAGAAGKLGIAMVPAAAIIAGEISGFGIYMATTTGLGALSTALGITFPWMVYQGATTALGVVLGPIGWVAVGGGIFAMAGKGAWDWLRRREDAKLTAVVVGLIWRIGPDPFAWFGLGEGASRAEVQTAFRAVVKLTHPDRTLVALPPVVKAQMDVWYITAVEMKKEIELCWEEYS